MPVLQLPRDHQSARIGLGIVRGQKRNIGRVADQIDKGQFVMNADRPIVGRRFSPVPRQDRIAQSHMPGLGQRHGFVELRQAENAPGDEKVAQRDIRG